MEEAKVRVSGLSSAHSALALNNYSFHHRPSSSSFATQDACAQPLVSLFQSADILYNVFNSLQWPLVEVLAYPLIPGIHSQTLQPPNLEETTTVNQKLEMPTNVEGLTNHTIVQLI